jgi:hypothetical protein
MTTETYQLWSVVTNGLVGIGTIGLAILAVFQDRIRRWLDAPVLRAYLENERPDCVWVPFRHVVTGQHVADSVHLRFRVKNEGRSAARRVEAYAEQREEFQNGRWDVRRGFPSMNLNWADVGGLYFESISPWMAKHCDLAHVIDPGLRRGNAGEENPTLNLPPTTTSLTFSVIVRPNHQGHIVGPGRYRLTVILAAENANPRTERIEIELHGQWYPDEARMLRDGIRAAVVQ